MGEGIGKMVNKRVSCWKYPLTITHERPCHYMFVKADSVPLKIRLAIKPDADFGFFTYAYDSKQI